MKPVKTFHLLCEPMFSFGRFVAIVGIFAIPFYFFLTDYGDIVSGKFYHYSLQLRILDIFAYGLFISFIIAGLIGHKVQKWYEYKIEWYPDNWTRAYMKAPGDTWEWLGDIPPDRIVKVARYYKRYSKRKKNWYIWIRYAFMYKKDAYVLNAYGWIDRPEEIKDYDRFVATLRKIAEENRKSLNVKIPPRILWFGLATWRNRDYANELYEQREKLIKEDGNNDWSS